MEQDVYCLIIFTVAVIIMNELQEFSHLVFGDRFPGHAVVHHHACKLKAEGILLQAVIIHSHPESWTKDTADRLYGAVPLPIMLEIYQKKLSVRGLYFPDLLPVEVFFLKDVRHEVVIHPRGRLHADFGLQISLNQLHHCHFEKVT